MTPDIVRAWAKEQGIAVGVRGRIKAEVYAAYNNRSATDAIGARARGDAVAEREALDRIIVAERRPAPKPRKPRVPKPAPDIRAEAVRGPEATTLITGAPMRVIGEQGNWRFLALVVQPGGKVYVDCVDPGGVGRAIDPSKLALAHKSVTAADVRPKLAEREASATAHAHTRKG